MTKRSLLAVIGPGILVAATGVGAGDLATGALTGSKLGVAVLWAVVVGAFLKYVLNEGLARWQLATGTTLLEGCVRHFGRAVQYGFLAYLVFWSFFVGSALISASGVCVDAIIASFLPEPTDGSPRTTMPHARIVFGLLQSAIGVVLVRAGGYRLFEKVMSACIAVMFAAVIGTAAVVKPSWSAIVEGLFIPTIPDAAGEGLPWTIALLGGIGGTVTVLCYGYWIREEGRVSIESLRTCRIDLAVGYASIALFGIGMIIVGSRIEVEGDGVRLVVQLADQLQTDLGAIGPAMRWLFLAGAWAAVFTSLLGVWQSVPYLFADFWSMLRAGPSAVRETVDTGSRAYRYYLYAIATIPAIGLWVKFERVQMIYAIVGAAFIPLLAVALLFLNGTAKYVGAHRNSAATNALLVGIILLAIVVAWIEFPA